MPPYDIQPTPNPNSLKFQARGGSFAVDDMVSASSPAEAVKNKLASQLFGIDGVANVFIMPQFLTVTKRPDVEWDDILPTIEELLTAKTA